MSAELAHLPRRGDLPKSDGYESLPPRSVWVEDLDTVRYEMPVDDRGLVDVPRLTSVIESVVDPNYVWPNRLSVHHLYWHKSWYEEGSAGPHARSFRELSINKILVPRMFENVLHKIMEPPEVPHPDVMEQQLDAWLTARHLFQSMRSVVRWEKVEEQYIRRVNNGDLPKGYETEDQIGREILRGTLSRHVRGASQNMRVLATVAPGYRLIEPVPDIADSSKFEATKTERQAFASQLGRIMMPKAVPVVRALKVA